MRTDVAPTRPPGPAAEAAPTATGHPPRSGPRRGLLGVAGVLTLVVVLELVPRTGIADERYLPPLSRILAALADSAGTAEFWQALGDTLVTWVLGLAIATVAGLVLGMVIGSVRLLREATASTIEFLRPIPPVALIPLAVLTLGTGRESTLLLVVYATFWQVLIQVLYGVRDIDPVARDTARAYRFRTIGVLRQLVWPTALPYAVTGFRLGAAVALILTITGELIIGTPGLGSLLATFQQAGQYASMYAVVVVTGLLGVVVNLLTRMLERRVLHWHPSVRREAQQ
jgi:ABC-type nitrate/sulfonate/bicarbonate transport system permease component